MPTTSGMATCWGLLELVGLGLGLAELGLGLGLGRLGLVALELGEGALDLGEGAGLPDLVGLLELGGVSLAGATAPRVGWGPGVCLRVGRLFLPGVVDE
jgi:hypothetical protein